MKKLLLSTILFSCMHFAFSQNISLTEDKVITGDESVNGWLFQVCEDEDFVRDDIKKFLKERYGLKAKKKNKYTAVVPEAELPNISTKRGDLIIYLQHSDTGNIMALSFVLGYDISLNSKDNEAEMAHFREVAKDFIEYHYNSYYSDKIGGLDKQLNSAKKDLHKKESDISSMKKKEMNLDKKLSKEEDNEKKMELEKDIEELLAEIETTYDLLPALKEQIETMQEERDNSKQELLSYQNQIKKL